MSSPEDEKQSLPIAVTDSPSVDKAPHRIFRRAAISTIVITTWLLLHSALGVAPWPLASRNQVNAGRRNTCQQAEPLYPTLDVSRFVHGEERQIVDWLADAVKIPTEIFDVMGEVGEDSRWDVFYDFADYLRHQHLNRTRVMTHALAYEWHGSDPSLKPLLLTGHQDVVPVLNATRGLWTHDPYGGFYDEETGFIWGRGSCDDKSGTIGVLSAVELLLKSGQFKPARTVILAFGIDEETGGKVGAYALGQWIEEKYGADSIAMLVDEGNGLTELWGQLYATPAVGEKGYLDVEVRVQTAGGHSSIPPPHTGIGYLSLLVAALEKHPHEARLKMDSPLVNSLSCAAEYAPHMPKDLKKAVRKLEEDSSHKSGKVDKRALKAIRDWWVGGSYQDGTLPKGMGRALVSTTQAVDVISGGLKVNALPEDVYAIVNHRINIASSVSELKEHLIHVLAPVAKEYDLSLEAFGNDVKYCGWHSSDAKKGKVILSEAFNSSLDPAAVSPFTVDSPAWSVLSGTTRGVYNTRPHTDRDDSSEIYMAPSTSTGNTDTKRYWNLTKNIYRFAYLDRGDASGAHTVDENICDVGFIELTRWFMNLIVNVDESRHL